MVEIWFSSDHHFWHDNIIKFSDRPFADVQEMNEALVQRHNESVKSHDHWYCLGDVTLWRGSYNGIQARQFIKLVHRMNGHKRLLLGNHDHFPIQVYTEAGFEKIYATWRGIDNILLSHVPVHPRSIGSAKANVHGHTHCQENFDPVIQLSDDGKRVVYKPYVNISVEQTDYRPIHLDTVNKRIDKAKGEYEQCKVGHELLNSSRPA